MTEYFNNYYFYILLFFSLTFILIPLYWKIYSNKSKGSGKRFDIEAIRKVYEEDTYTPAHIKAMDYVCNIKANGDCEIKHTMFLFAEEEPIQFYTYWIDADENTHPIHDIREINFNIECLTPSECVSFETIENEPYKKKIAILFEPELKPGEKRELYITFQWPNFMGKLLNENETTFIWQYKRVARDFESHIRFRLFFAPEIGEIDVINQGAQLDEKYSSLKKIGSDVRVWQYENPAIIIGSKKLEFLFRRNIK